MTKPALEADELIDSAAALTREAIPEVVNWTELGIAVAVTVVLAVALHRLVFAFLRRFARRTESQVDDILVRRLDRPSLVALIAIALAYVAQFFPILAEAWATVGGIVMPLLIGWLAIAILRAFIAAMSARADITVADNLQARRKRTRLTLIGRVATFVIVFVTAALMMLSIPGIRDIGLTLIASAGLAGLAVGAAAQPALRSLIAGTQMALTEPINIDDVVIVEGEWGRIEDIRTTYVLVKIWDERRLVVPTTYFLEKPFENWTKHTADLLGTVLVYLDPSARLERLRAEFERRVAQHPNWDGKVAKVQVTDASVEAKEVRLLMSAANASLLFDLRCDMREAMLDWLAEHQPESFPRTRLSAAAVEDERGNEVRETASAQAR
jgi:small-conductance mechanosensitive channel